MLAMYNNLIFNYFCIKRSAAYFCYKKIATAGIVPN